MMATGKHGHLLRYYRDFRAHRAELANQNSGTDILTFRWVESTVAAALTTIPLQITIPKDKYFAVRSISAFALDQNPIEAISPDDLINLAINFRSSGSQRNLFITPISLKSMVAGSFAAGLGVSSFPCQLKWTGCAVFQPGEQIELLKERFAVWTGAVAEIGVNLIGDLVSVREV